MKESSWGRYAINGLEIPPGVPTAPGVPLGLNTNDTPNSWAKLLENDNDLNGNDKDSYNGNDLDNNDNKNALDKGRNKRGIDDENMPPPKPRQRTRFVQDTEDYWKLPEDRPSNSVKISLNSSVKTRGNELDERNYYGPSSNSRLESNTVESDIYATDTSLFPPTSDNVNENSNYYDPSSGGNDHTDSATFTKNTDNSNNYYGPSTGDNIDYQGHGHRNIRNNHFQSPSPSHTSLNSRTQHSSTSTSRYGHHSSTIATSAISIHDTNHARLRRLQRLIPRRDVQEAIKHGHRTQDHFRLHIYNYEFKGHRYIIDEERGELITSYMMALDLEKKEIGQAITKKHQRAINKIRSKKATIKSHSVIVVDKSGSMRNSDISGAKTRLGAVWLSLAQDYILNRIESGVANDSDVVTIILMSTSPTLLIDRWPTDYILYNAIVQHFNDSKIADPSKHFGGREKIPKGFIKPGGHGCYTPAMNLAQQLLESNDNSSCALNLMILSDGRPSDFYVDKVSREVSTKQISERVGRMASKFGRRFNFHAIGMGSLKDFSTLEKMANNVNDFGGFGGFKVPSMSCADVGAAISSVATSLTTCQTELSNMKNGARQRKVRECIREKKSVIPLLTEVVDKENFDIYMGNNVQHMIYTNDEDGMKTFKPAPLQHPEARGVAFKKMAFGEGSERLAHQFFEIEEDGVTVIGPPLVAKESRFIEEKEEKIRIFSDKNLNKISKNSLSPSNIEDKWVDRDDFAKRFCKLQYTACNAARMFNLKLDEIKNLDDDTPRISFLECSIYYLNDEKKGDYAVVVEKKLHGKFQKWNNNNGWHNGQKNTRPSLANVKEETESIHESEQEEEGDGTELHPIPVGYDIHISKDEVAQAFSHFTFIFSRKKMLICDLQGVYDSSQKMLCFTDPVIHYHNALKKGMKRGNYGRTDVSFHCDL